MEDLKEKLQVLKDKYPDKEASPPDDVKRDLLSRLDVLQDE